MWGWHTAKRRIQPTALRSTIMIGGNGLSLEYLKVVFSREPKARLRMSELVILLSSARGYTLVLNYQLSKYRKTAQALFSKKNAITAHCVLLQAVKLTIKYNSSGHTLPLSTCPPQNTSRILVVSKIRVHGRRNRKALCPLTPVRELFNV